MEPARELNIQERTLRILVVEHSPTVRLSLKLALEELPSVAVVETVRSGRSAMEKLAIFEPHLIMLDMDLPDTNPLQLLHDLTERCARPVVLLTTLNKRSSELSVRALQMGAADVIMKSATPEMNYIGTLHREALLRDLNRKVIAVAEAFVVKSSELYDLATEREFSMNENLPRQSPNLVVIGASTGGTEGIRLILASLPRSFPTAILIVQHMPAGFTASFAEQLDSICAIDVREARENSTVRPGRALIAPGDAHMVLREDSGGRYVSLAKSDPVHGHRPSVDVLFESVARTDCSRTMALLLSGMGEDGARGMQQISQAGGFTIAQDEASCVVFGMPRAAIDLGAINRVAPVSRIASLVKRSVKLKRAAALNRLKRYAENVAT